MAQIAREFFGGWVVKASAVVVARNGLEKEVVKIISPRAYQSRPAAEEFRTLAVRNGAKDAFVTDKLDDA